MKVRECFAADPTNSTDPPLVDKVVAADLVVDIGFALLCSGFMVSSPEPESTEIMDPEMVTAEPRDRV